MKLALFDLDHTLLPIDSDHSWGEFTIQLGWVDAQSFAQQNDAFYEQYKAGTLDIHAYIRFSTAAFRSQGPERAAQAHAQFMREVIEPAIRPEALALLQKHRDAGDHIVIITATNEFVTRPIAQAFGVSELIAIELERGTDGWYTGEIRGTPSFREGKVARLQQWLVARGLDWDDCDMTFYSDSTNDLPLLEKAHQPVATNPGAALREIAQQRGWPILDLFPETA